MQVVMQQHAAVINKLLYTGGANAVMDLLGVFIGSIVTVSGFFI